MTKSQTPSIASITTAFNSAKVLPRQLDALLRQSRPVDRIVVVNNASTDGTLDVLARYPRVEVLNLPANVGVGGAFSAGLDYAVKEKGHDWAWLLDDDSVPHPTALEFLSREAQRAEKQGIKIGVLACIPIHEGTQLAYPGLLWDRGWIAPPPESTQQKICFVDAVISSGSLVNSDVVATVGLPRAEFFMDFVDFEYCLRLRRHGYKIAVVHESLLDHAVGDPRLVNILGYSRTWADHPSWREYYMARNQVFTIWTQYPDWKSKMFVLRKLLRHAGGILLFGKDKGACLKRMCLGFFDGRAGRLGIRFVGSSPPPPSGAAAVLVQSESAGDEGHL